MQLIENLIYRSPAPTELEQIKDRLKFSLLGTQAYTHIVVDGELSAELFKIGTDENGEIKDLLFVVGDIIYLFRSNREYVLHNAEILPNGKITGDRTVVLESGKVREHCENDNNIKKLTGKEISDAFRLFTNGNMTHGDELRYTFRVRCANRDLAAVYGIYDSENSLLSTASIIAVNEKYALIGDIYTRPDVRGHGFASALLQHCSRRIMQRNRAPFLLCDESMTKFYKNNGASIIINN